MAKRWKKTDVTYLRRYAKKKRVSELAERFDTDASAVHTKLAELGLTALDSVVPTALEQSPSVDELQKGLKALHEGKWRQAATIFESVVGTAQQTELVATARRYLEVCREQLARKRKTEETDPYLMAVVERNRGNPDEAHAICSAGGRRSKDPRFAYLAAALFAEQEEYDEAARFLELAFELDPATRVHAQLDSDFERMRALPEHADLF